MTNVAYKKPVTLSSTGAGASENAVDGIVNVFYSIPFEQSHATASGKVSMCELLLEERLYILLLLVLLAVTVLTHTVLFPPDFLLGDTFDRSGARLGRTNGSRSIWEETSSCEQSTCGGQHELGRGCSIPW